MLETPRSRYQQVADLLRAAIQSGDYAPGSPLPSQPELAATHGINQTSIGKAIAILRREGLVQVVKGRGAFVRSIPAIHRHAVERYSRSRRESGQSRGAFDTELRELGHVTRTELIRWGRTTAPPVAARALQLPEGSDVAVRQRHMFADDTPVQIATSYIPWTLAEGTPISEQDTGPGGTYSRLADIGRPVAYFTEEVHTCTPTTEEAEILELDEDQQVYSIVHIACDAEDQPVEVCLHTMPTAQWVLHYRWPAD